MSSSSPDVGTPPTNVRKRWLSRLLGWLLTRLGFLGGLLLVTWATLAIYFSNLPWLWLRLTVAVAFAAFSVWALWLTRRPRMGPVFAGLFAAVVVWHILI